MATSSYTFRTDSELRRQSEAIYSALGISLETAINVFLMKSVAAGSFPFDVRLEGETVEAMLEAEKNAKDPKIASFSVDNALAELKR